MHDIGLARTRSARATRPSSSPSCPATTTATSTGPGLIDAAAEAGADAVKLQTYTPDTITLDHDGPGFSLGDGPLGAARGCTTSTRGAHALRLARAAVRPRPRRAAWTGLLRRPSTRPPIDLLESLDAPAYKIASSRPSTCR